jgi:hypothetical protein
MKSVMEDALIAVPLGEPLNADAILGAFAHQAWAYFREHGDDIIFRVNRRIFGITISYDVRLRQARPLMVKLFGEEPLP